MDPILGGSLISAGSSLLGSLFGGSGDTDWRRQKTVMKNQIQWKVADAKAAGISPLYALGAPTTSWSGSVGSEPSIGNTLASMGQDIGRAVAAKSTDAERAIQALTLDKAALENEFLREQIRSIRTRTIRESAPPLPGLVPERAVPPQRTTGVNFGRGSKSHPRFSDAQTYEDRYGELGGSILGLINIPADAIHNTDVSKLNSNPYNSPAWANIYNQYFR